MQEEGTNVLIPNHLVGLFEQSSLATIAIAVTAALMISAVVGLLVRRVPGLLFNSASADDGQEAYVVSAVLGLLALLMGFTFSLALDRYEDRRDLVLQEANAIGTAYLRTQLLAEPSRADISATLKEYQDNRLRLAGEHDADFDALLARNDELLIVLWDQTMDAVEAAGPTPVTALFMSSINEVIDLDASRKNARASKVPSAVYATLMIYMMISAAILGYVLVGFWARFAAIFLFLLFTLALLLIVDIDRPLTGQLREVQTPMLQLRDFMNAAPPERFDMPEPGPEASPEANPAPAQ